MKTTGLINVPVRVKNHDGFYFVRLPGERIRRGPVAKVVFARSRQRVVRIVVGGG